MRRRSGSFRPADYAIPQVAALFVVILTVLSGGGYHVWSQGLILMAIGLWIAWSPPDRSPGRLLNIAVAGLLLLGLLQVVLPSLEDSGWREAFTDHGMEHSGKISPQPLVTLQSLVTMLAGAAWLFLMCSLPLNAERRERTLQVWAVAMGIMGLLIYVWTVMGVRNPLAPEVHCFSFLPNRNQNSILVATGGVAAFSLAFEKIIRYRWVGLMNLVLGAACCVGMLALLSRAGILLFVGGCVLWIVLAWRRGDFAERWKWIFAVSFWMLIGLLFLGGTTSLRLHEWLRLSWEPGQDFRWLVFADAFRLIQDNLWQGVGLGNFRDIFPFYRFHSVSDELALHPESDWLWLWAETGLPGMLLVVLGVIGCWRILLFTDQHIDRYRKIAGICLLVFALHSFVDVSFHRMGTWMAAGLIMGLARPSVRGNYLALWLPPAAWRVVGAGIALAGTVWAFSGLTGWTLHRQSVVQEAQVQVRNSGVSVEEMIVAVEALESLQAKLPLSWELLYLRGQLAYQDGNIVEGEKAFRRLRALQSSNPAILQDMGNSALPYYTIGAMIYFREMLQAERDEERAVKRFAQLAHRIRRFPDALPALDALSRTDADYRVIFLQSLPNQTFLGSMQEELNQPQPLRDWPLSNSIRLMRRFLELGGGLQLEHFFAQDTEMQQLLWPVYAQLLTQKQELEAAYEILVLNLPEPKLPNYGENTSTAFLRGLLKVNSNDLAAAATLMQRYYEAGEKEAALGLFRTLRLNQQTPGFFNYWGARLFWETGAYEQSWDHWNQYIDRIIVP